jgi:hypothetical protein
MSTNLGTVDLNLIEAPVTWRAYLICGFASFGGKTNELTSLSSYHHKNYPLINRHPLWL